jgi:fructose-1,6-bisphosphatase/inositol monophosphatase family enzyme
MEGKEKALQGLYQGDLKCRTYPDALGYYLLLQGSVRAFVDPKVEIWDVAPFHVILPEAGFAIHPWTGDPKLARGTSVAYALDALGKPVHCLDVLRTLDET